MTRKGSALLIVLGMMAFMVVSAVAFSIYMRQSRLPSSFLRQKIAASQLVKAGLACAMQRIDAAIGDSPYPGIGDLSPREVQFRTNDRTYMTTTYGNYWENRVFVESQTAKESIYDSVDAFKPTFDPVATLTLEGLAYLPPSLVNTVRYHAKRVSPASWASLGYDAGRYAFTAVNVSDYPDITRIRANAMRDSTPGNRLSLGYLFENEQHTGPGTVSPAAFEAFIGKSTNDSFRTRFVSLADFNLAVGSGVYGDAGFTSPFCDYIRNPPKDGSFYGSRKEDAKALRFVTDSWFPGSLTNGTAVALTDLNEGQPFSGMENASLDDLQALNGSQAFKIIRERLDLCSLAALYDYLDENSVPISLAIPTLEHVPMLTGLRVTPEGFNVKLGSKETTEKKGTPENPETWVRKSWWLDVLGENPKVIVSACFAYPFARSSNMSRPSSYEVQVLVRAFFSEESADFSNTRFTLGNLKPGKNDWKSENALPSSDRAYISLFKSQKVSVSEGTDENHCAIDLPGIELPFDANALQKAWVYGLYYMKEDKEKTCKYDDSRENIELSPGLTKKLVYRDISKGRGVEIGNDTKLKLNFAVWVRVLDGNDTVDLVPAMLSDDQEYNGFNSGDVAGDAPKICGSTDPVIPLSSDSVLKLDRDRFMNSNGAQDPVEMLGDLAILCDDPRFNYAPEDWYQVKDGNDARSLKWLEAAKARCNGADHRSHDIFMFVSDSGYDLLQSMGELQFLPYIRTFRDRRDPTAGTFYDAGKYNGKPFAERTSPNACVNSEFAWKTHWAFGDYDDALEGSEADPTKWGILDSIGGPTVSPYAEESMMMAALANTPYDWAVAAGGTGMALEDGRQYCFGPSSTEAKMEWDDLLDIAGHIKSQIGTGTDWERAWSDNLDWDGDNFLGSALDRTHLHDVDRKFLYSYWRSCFGNDQQLFLIFVRAEPSVMGGSSAGHTPAQLGARAVALVWREPKSTVRDTQDLNGTQTHPHRMRILFYRQFE